MLNKFATPCFCGSHQIFELCCNKYITNQALAENPEQLMRSRYSAYVLKNESYLLSSWHNTTRPESLELTNDSTQWMGLKIITTSNVTVEFAAYFTQDTLNKDKIYALMEKSHFIKENNWQYLNGENVKTVQMTKNMPCPCQSGKKFKRCCGKKLLA